MSSAKILNDALTDLPEFRLEYSFDNSRRPSEVTVFDKRASAGILTSWLTMDIDHTVDLEECR